MTHPDRLLDPGSGLTKRGLADRPALETEEGLVGLAMRAALGALDLDSFLKTTGGKGLHIVAPIRRDHEWPVVKEFARGRGNDGRRRPEALRRDDGQGQAGARGRAPAMERSH